MNNINWKAKLASRKLWIGVIGLIVGVVLYLNGDHENGWNLIALSCTSYLGSETLVDIARSILNAMNVYMQAHIVEPEIETKDN